jgi:hypothetical protein
LNVLHEQKEDRNHHSHLDLSIAHSALLMTWYTARRA